MKKTRSDGGEIFSLIEFLVLHWLLGCFVNGQWSVSSIPFQQWLREPQEPFRHFSITFS